MTHSTLVTALEWNLAIGLQSERHARRQMRAIAAMDPNPHILVLVEARRTLYDVYVSELSPRTSRSWAGVLQGHCSRSRWNASTGSCEKQDDECVMVLSSFPVVSSDTILLPRADAWHSARAAVHAAIDVEGVTVHVFGTHLQAGPDTSVPKTRFDSIVMLKTWMATFGSPAIVGGDFNALPGSEEIAAAGIGVAPALADTWDLCGTGPAATYPAWLGTLKIDYWFADCSQNVRTISTRVARRVWLSDHLPLEATFEVSVRV